MLLKMNHVVREGIQVGNNLVKSCCRTKKEAYRKNLHLNFIYSKNKNRFLSMSDDNNKKIINIKMIV